METKIDRFMDGWTIVGFLALIVTSTIAIMASTNELPFQRHAAEQQQHAANGCYMVSE